jgi:uncharacterized protein involved in tolerance to divalent cations
LRQQTQTGENIPNNQEIYLITKNISNNQEIYLITKNISNNQEIYQLAIKYTNWSYNVPNGHIPIISTSSIARPSKIYPNWDFWLENIPSGNHGAEECVEGVDKP